MDSMTSINDSGTAEKSPQSFSEKGWGVCMGGRGWKDVLQMSSDVRVVFHGTVPYEDRVYLSKLGQRNFANTSLKRRTCRTCGC